MKAWRNLRDGGTKGRRERQMKEKTTGRRDEGTDEQKDRPREGGKEGQRDICINYLIVSTCSPDTGRWRHPRRSPRTWIQGTHLQLHFSSRHPVYSRILYVTPCILHNIIHYTLYTAQYYTLHPVYSRILYITPCILHNIIHYTLYTAQYWMVRPVQIGFRAQFVLIV